MEEDSGLTIVMTPVQMAGLFVGEEIPAQSSISNRLWGTAALVGSVFELIGAGLLCVAPEPTMATKVGCVIVGAHGIDSMVAASRKVWTGRDQNTLTARAVKQMATGLGASAERSEAIALGVDVAVPFLVSAGIGAARVIAISREGRIVLAEHEAAQAGAKLGGHTLLKHVGQTDAQLIARLAATAGAKNAPKAISTFDSLKVAEKSISEVFRANAAQIQNWSKSAGAGARLPLEHTLSYVVGRGVVRGANASVPLSKIRVVLKMEFYNNKPFYILTAFPIP